jgi:hypothetical protein
MLPTVRFGYRGEQFVLRKMNCLDMNLKEMSDQWNERLRLDHLLAKTVKFSEKVVLLHQLEAACEGRSISQEQAERELDAEPLDDEIFPQNRVHSGLSGLLRGNRSGLRRSRPRLPPEFHEEIWDDGVDDD